MDFSSGLLNSGRDKAQTQFFILSPTFGLTTVVVVDGMIPENRSCLVDRGLQMSESSTPTLFQINSLANTIDENLQPSLVYFSNLINSQREVSVRTKNCCRNKIHYFI